ncbi:hypothetical protein L798_09814 [Zootermopsis nevadensis]|uniref:Uncharacterized protein n=1 Tax=Zootermopsis nevadensis TaxID=136037 RepID=A0A067RB49_ZOONE|nr:hypothetical protein L798_09814 [Zootermopsis nevadensis]
MVFCKYCNLQLECKRVLNVSLLLPLHFLKVFLIYLLLIKSSNPQSEPVTTICCALADHLSGFVLHLYCSQFPSLLPTPTQPG